MLTKDHSIKQKKQKFNYDLHALTMYSRLIYCSGHLRLIDENTQTWPIKSQ